MESAIPTTMSLNPFVRLDERAFGKQVCRLGLATRGDTGLTASAIEHALHRGVNFLNWPGVADAPTDPLCQVVARLGQQREQVVVCVQFSARTSSDAAIELDQILSALGTDYVDVLTLYYVEELSEWQELIGAQGALHYCRAAQAQGRVRRVGLTTHQRPLAATVAQSGLLDALMLRYNAAHRGAEQEVFTVTLAAGLPIIAYTCLRWGALLQPTAADPPGFAVPRAPLWYRFALQSPAVAVALAAPANRTELDEDLTVLAAMGPLAEAEYQQLIDHGQRVRQHAGQFP